MKKIFFNFSVFLIFSILLSCSNKHWRDRSRESSGIGPKVSELNEDIVQIYYARAVSWRGFFGIHPWVSWKKVSDSEFTVAQVTAWNLKWGGGQSTVSVKKDLPDRIWYDNVPTIMYEARGEKASKIILQLEKLIPQYPYQKVYRVWPGPNSNTFVAYLIREIDEFDLELPAHAVGKDYLGPRDYFFAPTASETGFQFSIFGLLGFSLGLAEGIEVNLLGLNFGVDFWTPALKLPSLGRVGFADQAL
jgi:hypothetical protein